MKRHGKPSRQPHTKEDSSRRTELMISSILRYGVTLSAMVIALGMILLFFRGNSASKALGMSAVLQYPHSLGAMLRGLQSLDPSAIVELGLALLIATPVLRVASSIVAFAWSGDRLYTIITLLVLILLVAGMVLGYGAG